MNPEIFLTVLGFLVGIIGGMLGVGGGLLIVPALVFLPHYLGLHSYDIHHATGVAVTQAFVGGTASLWQHYKNGAVILSLVTPLILGGLVGGFTGGYASGFIPDIALYILFAVVLVLTMVLAIFFPVKDISDNQDTHSWSFNVWQGFLIGGLISFFSAHIGIGGAILLVPILIYLKRVPTRLAIGTGAGMVVITGLSAFIGKLMANLVPFPDALWVSLGALFGGMVGARISQKVSTLFLRKLLFILITLTLIRVIFKIVEIY